MKRKALVSFPFFMTFILREVLKLHYTVQLKVRKKNPKSYWLEKPEDRV